MDSGQWTVERALREGRADLLMFNGNRIASILNLTHERFWINHIVDGKFCGNLCDVTNPKLIEKLSLATSSQPEPDGPPRDWPSIWRQQLREHVNRAPMIPREYVQEVLDMIDFGMVTESLPLYMEDQVKP